MTKLCIFGADGRTGVEVVKTALLKEHGVTAFVYNKDSNKYFDSSVNIINGNVLSYQDVERAVQGADAVISVVGHIKKQ